MPNNRSKIHIMYVTLWNMFTTRIVLEMQAQFSLNKYGKKPTRCRRLGVSNLCHMKEANRKVILSYCMFQIKSNILATYFEKQNP